MKPRFKEQMLISKHQLKHVLAIITASKNMGDRILFLHRDSEHQAIGDVGGFRTNMAAIYILEMFEPGGKNILFSYNKDSCVHKDDALIGSNAKLDEFVAFVQKNQSLLYETLVNVGTDFERKEFNRQAGWVEQTNRITYDEGHTSLLPQTRLEVQSAVDIFLQEHQANPQYVRYHFSDRINHPVNRSHYLLHSLRPNKGFTIVLDIFSPYSRENNIKGAPKEMAAIANLRGQHRKYRGFGSCHLAPMWVDVVGGLNAIFEQQGSEARINWQASIAGRRHLRHSRGSDRH